MKKKEQILKVQGDLYFVKLNALPKFSKRPKKLNPENGRIVLRRGEATGHEHAIRVEKPDKVDVFQKGKFIYIFNSEDVMVTHPEHRPIVLEPGIWMMGVQREFDPFPKENHQKENHQKENHIRPVRD